MSFEIPISYVEQFSANVHMLSEQQMTRLGMTVMREDVTGESFAKERIGSVEAQLVANLHGDTPLNSTPHSRRWGYIKDYDVADLIDKESDGKLLIDPQSRYTMRHASAMARAKDDEIIRALGGTAQAGKNGTTAVALPSVQQIAVGATGLTTAKLRTAKRTLDAAEVDEFIPRFCAISARQLEDLLTDSNVINSDFATVKALVQGEVNTWLGFNFVRTERLLLDGSGDRLCYAYAMMAVTLGMQRDTSSVVAPRPDKRMSQQVYTWMSLGAVRVEDEMVVEIACDEP
ncbi:MAG: phage capsid protein [Pseudohongiellaceae bacterium]